VRMDVETQAPITLIRKKQSKLLDEMDVACRHTTTEFPVRASRGEYSIESDSLCQTTLKTLCTIA